MSLNSLISPVRSSELLIKSNSSSLLSPKSNENTNKIIKNLVTIYIFFACIEIKSFFFFSFFVCIQDNESDLDFELFGDDYEDPLYDLDESPPEKEEFPQVTLHEWDTLSFVQDDFDVFDEPENIPLGPPTRLNKFNFSSNSFYLNDNIGNKYKNLYINVVHLSRNVWEQ